MKPTKRRFQRVAVDQAMGHYWPRTGRFEIVLNDESRNTTTVIDLDALTICHLLDALYAAEAEAIGWLDAITRTRTKAVRR